MVIAAPWSNFSAQIDVSTPRKAMKLVPSRPNHNTAHRCAGVTCTPGQAAMASHSAKPTNTARVTDDAASANNSSPTEMGGIR